MSYGFYKIIRNLFAFSGIAVSKESIRLKSKDYHRNAIYSQEAAS